MNRNKLFSAFIIFCCSSQILNAEDFKYLLDKALESNSNLKLSKIEIKTPNSDKVTYDNMVEFSFDENIN